MHWEALRKMNEGWHSNDSSKVETVEVKEDRGPLEIWIRRYSGRIVKEELSNNVGESEGRMVNSIKNCR